MKINRRLALLGGCFFFFLSQIHAQYYSPKSRSLETYRDLPEIFIRQLKPNVASDYAYVKYVAADTFEIFIYVSPWMSKKDTLFSAICRVMPGNQEITLGLMGLNEGWYEVYFFYKNRKISSESLQIQR